MTLEVNYKWLSCLLSLIIVFLLREQFVWLTAYVGCVMFSLMLYFMVWPRLARRTYENLHLRTLSSVSESSLADCEAALHKAKWLKRSPCRFGFWDLMGVIAYRRGQREEAIRHWRKALQHAPLSELRRIRTNLNRAIDQGIERPQPTLYQ